MKSVTGTLLGDLCAFMIISHRVILRVRNFETEFVEKTKPHILYSINFFFRK
jgi:hypothetical protein